MTLLLEAVDAKLRSITSLTALVGNRIFGNKAPQWTADIKRAFGEPFPRIVYQDSTVEQHRHLEGSDGSALIVVTIDIYSQRYLQAKQIAEILRVNLDTFRGDMGGVLVDEVSLESMNDFYEDPVDGSDVGSHSVSIDFFFWHQQPEATP
jgi:hypothetical protein